MRKLLCPKIVSKMSSAFWGCAVAIAASACSFVLDYEPNIELPDGGALICERDEHCEDHIACTEKVCVDGICELADEGDTRDLDNDGYASQACGGTDCNDNNPDVHHGEAEVCNGKDDDCDDEADEGLFLVGEPAASIRDCHRPALARGERDLALVCWQSQRIMMAQVSGEGAILEELTDLSGASYDTGSEVDPAISFSQTRQGFAISWIGSGEVHTSFVGQSKEVWSTFPVQQPGDWSDARVSVAWTSSGFVTGWSDAAGVHVAHAEQSQQASVLSEVGTKMQLARLGQGGNVLVGWVEGTNIVLMLLNAGLDEVASARVNLDMAPHSISLATGPADSVLLAYEDHLTGAPNNADIFVRHIRYSGELSAEAPTQVSFTQGASRMAHVAWTGTEGEIGVSWREADSSIWLGRSSLDGIPLGTIPLEAEGFSWARLVSLDDHSYLSAGYSADAGIHLRVIGCR